MRSSRDNRSQSDDGLCKAENRQLGFYVRVCVQDVSRHIRGCSGANLKKTFWRVQYCLSRFRVSLRRSYVLRFPRRRGSNSSSAARPRGTGSSCAPSGSRPTSTTRCSCTPGGTRTPATQSRERRKAGGKCVEWCCSARHFVQAHWEVQCAEQFCA